MIGVGRVPVLGVCLAVRRVSERPARVAHEKAAAGWTEVLPIRSSP